MEELVATLPETPVPENKRASKFDVFIGAEWDTLEEVYIGLPDQFQYPSSNPVIEKRKHIVSEGQMFNDNACAHIGEFERLIIGGKPVEEPLKRMRKEFDDYVKCLEKYKIKVHRPHLLNGNVRDYLQTGNGGMFLKDPFITVGQYIFEGANRTVFRHKDVFSYRDKVLSQMAKPENYITLPKPQIDINYVEEIKDAPMATDAYYNKLSDKDGGKGPFLTGGDVFPLGKFNFKNEGEKYHILVGHNCVDTNLAGIDWLINFFKDKKIVEPNGDEIPVQIHKVEYSYRVMHVDTALSFPMPNLILYCPDAFPYGLPEVVKAMVPENRRVPCDMKDAVKDCTNGLPLGKVSQNTNLSGEKYVYIMPEEFKEKYGKKLLKADGGCIDNKDNESKNLIIEYVKMYVTNHLTGGGFRCAHGPVRRAGIPLQKEIGSLPVEH